MTPRPEIKRPDSAEGHADVGAEDTRQGVTTGRVRWVLAISLVLTILMLIAAGLWYSARSSSPHSTPPSAASNSA